MDLFPNKVIHFIGIGGCGMSAIARVLLLKGYKVSGSDLKESPVTVRLRDLGATIYIGHEPSNLRLADVVVVSSAISAKNPELKAAQDKGLPIYRRAEMLNIVMSDYPRRIGIAGTHGKTTTTSLITRMLLYANQDPTYVIGAELSDYGSNSNLGRGGYVVAESDESDGSFLLLNPNIVVLTNMEPEHMEYYKGFDNLRDHFQQFMLKAVQQDGYIVVNRDDPELTKLAEPFGDAVIYYGLTHEKVSLTAKSISLSPEGVRYSLFIDGIDHGEVLLRIHGRHNVYNSLAAISVGVKEGLSLDHIKKGLYNFGGTQRRLQLVGERQGITIYDDYGHHPTEIQTTLEGIKSSWQRRLVCIFQPHRYSRTRDLLERFPDAFKAADEVVLTEIYSAHEDKIDGISGRLIYDRMEIQPDRPVHFVEKKSDIVKALLPRLKEGDIVVTMGAGDIHTVGKELYTQLKAFIHD